VFWAGKQELVFRGVGGRVGASLKTMLASILRRSSARIANQLGQHVKEKVLLSLGLLHYAELTPTYAHQQSYPATPSRLYEMPNHYTISFLTALCVTDSQLG
jgi:hypothetical protein